ncbi:S8 family peptidase [Halobellus inordinatus]|uniref:S8 family peptidase n=1 Tax=Halobellus inordinatus TaxID=1126236 RepID=UPI0021156C0D|nr:S8 family peptidase [Halobellus ramosii]
MTNPGSDSDGAGGAWLTRRQALAAIGGTGLLGASGVLVTQAQTETPTDSPPPDGPDGGTAGPPVDRPRQVLVGVTGAIDRPDEVVADLLPPTARVVNFNETIHYVTVEFGDDTPRRDENQFIRTVQEDSRVKYVERNGVMEAYLVPDDPLFADQYGPQMINAPEAWDTTLGSSDVTVAIVDSGIQHDHEDLAANFADEPGRDFVDDDADPSPNVPEFDVHGTHVAGIAAAGINNAVGVAGATTATLIGARVLGDDGRGTFADIADGIVWAADQDADVINLSLGSIGRSRTVKNAVAYAYRARDSLVVAAAGNEGREGVGYPAAHQETLAVSALDETGRLAWFSSHGDRVSISAPGAGVLSTVPTESGFYGELSGTSMASPFVAGVAALTKAQYDISAETLREHLRATATDTGAPTEFQGAGRVDAAQAVGQEPGEVGCTLAGSTSGEGSLVDQQAQCWRHTWLTDSPCRVVVDLDGDPGTDFDLYINLARELCPFPGNADRSSVTLDSQERIVVDNPDNSLPLLATVVAYHGTGNYEISFAEFTGTLAPPPDTPTPSTPTESPSSPTETTVTPTESPSSPTETTVTPTESPSSPTETTVTPTETNTETEAPTSSPSPALIQTFTPESYR